MKKSLLILCSAILLSSCATVLGGKKTLKPNEDEPKRKVRWGYVVADVLLFPPGLIIDFAAGTIYREGKTE